MTGGGLPSPPSARSMAATWFLGLFVVAFVVLAWTRGMARFVVPLLAIGAVAWVVVRFVKALRAPVD
jgi:uncharacterized membrane protein required for colicin V production